MSKPVNVLAVPELPLAEIVSAGARRISVGGGLTWVALKAMADAAVAIRDRGDLSALGARLPLDLLVCHLSPPLPASGGRRGREISSHALPQFPNCRPTRRQTRPD